MVDEKKKTNELTTKTSAAVTDKFIFLYNAANSTTAQTALITLANLFSNTANLAVKFANVIVTDIRSAPANSESLTLPHGTLFFSNSYGYFATSNNHVKRFALSDF